MNGIFEWSFRILVALVLPPLAYLFLQHNDLSIRVVTLEASFVPRVELMAITRDQSDRVEGRLEKINNTVNVLQQDVREIKTLIVRGSSAVTTTPTNQTFEPQILAPRRKQ